MAKGLRKLIKKSRREFLNNSTVNRRFNRFGSRLRVEELEERIAPAAVDLSTPGAFAVWDLTGGTGETFDSTDGFIGIGENTTSGITVQVADISGAAGDDTATLNLTISADTAGAVAHTVEIITNQAIGSIDFSGLDDTATSLKVIIGSGVDLSAFSSGAATATVDGNTVTLTAADQVAVTNTFTIANGDDFAAVSNAGMGAITFDSGTSTDNTPVIAHIVTNGTGAIASITNANTKLDLTDDTSTDSLIDAGGITGVFTWAGDILPDANGVTITLDNDSGAGFGGAVTIGSINAAGAGSLAINTEGFGSTLTVTNGITISGAGNVAIDADASGTTDDGITGAVDLGGITLSGSGGFTLDGGDSGFTAAVATGTITTNSASTGDVSITTSTNGGFGATVTVAGIDMNSSGDSDITIQPQGTGDMSGVTLSGAIDMASSVVGSVTIGSTTGALGNLSLNAGGSAINMDATSANADVTIQGATIGTVTIGDIDVDGGGDLNITAGTSIGQINDIDTIDVTSSGDVTINAGTTGFTSTVAIAGAVTLSGSGGGDLTITTGSAGGFAGAVTFGGVITNSGTGDSDLTVQPGSGSGDMSGVTVSGLISNTSTATGAITFGSTTAALGDVSLAGITVASTSDDADVTFQGESIGSVSSSAAIQTDGSSVAGDILFDAAGSAATGSITDFDITTGAITSDSSDGTVIIRANDDLGDGQTMTIQGGIGGAGAVSFIANNGGTADTGNVGNITATTGDIGSSSGTVSISGAEVGNITATAGALESGLTITASKVTGNGSIGNLSSSTTLESTVTSDGTIGTVTAGTTLDGTITAGTSIGAITAGTDITGTITAGTSIASITSTNGDLTSAATIQAESITGAVTLDADESGTSKGNLAGTITTTGGAIGSIDVGGNITGTVTSDTTIGAITSDGSLQAAITAGTGFSGAIQIDDGITADGSLTATTGNFASTITIDTGGLAGSLTATTGNFTGLITVTAGGITSTGMVKATAGDIDGGITVTAGGIASGATISAGTNIDGDITATAGDIDADITAAQDISGDITATAGAISGTITATNGNLSGNITAGTGDITSIVIGGDIDDSGGNVTIQAEDDITSISVTGDIGGGGNTVTIASDSDSDNSGDIVSVVAGGAIEATITGQNIDLVRSGGASGDNITGTITADADIDLIDAGQANLTATTTATEATSSSPLATFIEGGVSYAVWAFESGSTTTVDSGVTAQVVFNGTTLAISNLADSTTATTPDIYVTTRQETGAEQAYTDADVDVNDAPISITVTAASAITVGTVSLEGDYTLGGATNITYTSLEAEGSVTGTVTVTTGQDLSYGGIGAGGLTITGSPGTLSVNENIAGDISISGSIDKIIVGTSGLGSVGNIADGADITITGSLGQLTVDGSVNGSISATTIGNISIGGNLGDGMTADESITATSGDVGDIFVSGTIGADAAQSMTIRSTNGSIGTITAVGTIGAGNGTTSIIANTNIAGVNSQNGDIGDAGTAVTITATNGTIGTISAAGSYGINGTITAEGDITAVSATYDDGTPGATEGILAGTITSNSGNIATVSTVEANISATVTATIGNVDSVVVLDGSDANSTLDSGINSATITAGGDVDTIAGASITGNTTATLGTAGSPVATWTAGNVVYTFDGTEGPIYNMTFNGAAKSINVTVDNWDNTGGAALASSVDIALTTSEIDSDGQTVLSDTDFDLTGLDFDSDSVTNSANTFGTITVEGDVTTNGIDTGAGGSISTLLVEGNVALPVMTDSVSLVAVGQALGIDNPTTTQMELMFVDPLGTGVTFGVPADGTYTIPVKPIGTDDAVSVALGDGSNLTGLTTLTAGDNGVSSYDVTVASGAITTIGGTQEGSGDVTISGDLDYVITGIDLDTITITGSVSATGGISAFDIGNITVGTAGDLNTGNMAGTISSTDLLAGDFGGGDNAANLNGDIGAVVVYGDLSGTITADGNITSVTVGQSQASQAGLTSVGSITGVVIAGGNLGDVTAQIDVGGSGLIMAGGSLGDITATTGDVTADIFAGGGGAGDGVSITGNSITGDLALGAFDGVGTVTLNIRTDANDATPLTYTITPGAAMFAEIGAGDLTTSGATVDRITMISDSNGLTASVNEDANIDVSEILVIENAAATFNLTIEGDLGTVIAADGNSAALDSATLESNFITAYNTAEGTSLTTDVVSSQQPTAMDQALTDDQNIDMNTTVTADSFDGIVASGDLTVTADLPVAGYMVSLNGSVSGAVHASTSIGDVVASENVTGTFMSEGTVAASATTLGTDLSTNYGLSGVPTWFGGGILAEVGNITADFSATANGELVGDVLVPNGQAMGTVYAMSGDITSDINVFGNMGGVQAPLANGILTLNVSGAVDKMIAPNLSENGNRPDAAMEVTNGETVVSENNPYAGGNVAVSASSGVLAIVDNNDADATSVDELTIVGLADGTSVTVQGDVDQLTVAGNWAGAVAVNGSALDDTTGAIDAISVNGDIEATATLTADKFGELYVTGDDSAVTETGTLNKANKVDTLTGGGQTLYFNTGNNATTAAWTAKLGKVTTVEVAGRGKVQFASAEGTKTESQMKDIINTGEIALGNADIGDFTAQSRGLTIDGLVVQGDMNSLSVPRMAKNVYVSGDAGDMKVGRKISNAFIGGDLSGTFATGKAIDIDILGNVDQFASAKAKNVTVLGTTDELYINGNAINSQFLGQVNLAYIFGKMKGETSVNGAVITDRYEVV